MENEQTKPNCQFCKNGGVVTNFMCHCYNPKLAISYKRSVGYRKCKYFELDIRKQRFA